MTADYDAVPLTAALDAGRFGGKAANLARALRSGLPVPDGVVLPPAAVRAVVNGAGLADLLERVSSWPDLLAVRSSAIGEDGATASFAGQHVTRLGVRATDGALRAAIAAVAASVNSPHARAYRQAMGSDRTGVTGPVAVLIQPMMPADVSGVMFTRDPVTGVDELVIEAVLGLGEAVVGGQVTPELCRMAPDGAVRRRCPGGQSVAVVASAAGGTQELPLAPGRSMRWCLDDQLLAALTGLAHCCRRVFADDGLDIEWCWAAGHVGLLQARPITASSSWTKQ